MTKRESKWTSIYWDYTEGRCYIRLTPVFLEMKALGFPHGMTVSKHTFESEEDAAVHADKIDKFMDALEDKIIEQYKNGINK